MNSRGPQSMLAVIALLLAALLLIVVVVFLVPEIRARLNPLEQARETLEREVGELLHPTPTIRPSPATIIREVQSLSRLETVVYTVEKIITAESGQGALAFLFGDKLLLVAHGQVIAGVDLSKVREGDVTVTPDDRVMLTLPPAEVFVVRLDSEKTYVYDRETGLFGMKPDLETAARQAAEQEILKAALADGILDTADRNARSFLEGFIRGFGFREVVFIQATPAASTLPVTVVPLTPSP
ncbi:MAG: DUF4230 domain-containing protein [Anaerolineae bacterium]|nr:DUF4230 domain-containing protein [Anaerolineae bacterium]MDW8068754.1 DUF4230 domain-containing protein [Anaerolineae bacterium]